MNGIRLGFFMSLVCKITADITADIQKRVPFYVNRMHKDKLINNKTKQYLIQSDVKPGRFYILPKVHKPGNPGRPIVSSNSHPTERLSHFVDYHLQPLVHKLPSFVKDTNDFLNKLLTIRHCAGLVPIPCDGVLRQSSKARYLE